MKRLLFIALLVVFGCEDEKQEKIYGCTDPTACNFNSDATIYVPNSCLYDMIPDCNGECGGDAVEDCSGVCSGTAVVDSCGVCDSDTTNDCLQDCAGFWDGNTICGCTDSTASNFNAEATYEDYSCQFENKIWDVEIIGNEIWATDTQGFYYSDNLGESWYFYDTNISLGGSCSALKASVDQTFIATVSNDGVSPIGGGISYTEDNGYSWIYHEQPVDSQTDTLANFSEKYFRALPVTVANSNVTYDAAVSDNYIWITSWAGGLRRIGITDAADPNNVWTRVPLPQDDQNILTTCDDMSYDENNILIDFYLNPRDPLDGGNHNHKAFSVLAYDDIVWVGTANGINKGIVDQSQSGCIDWEHYSFPEDGISGNFVVGLARQVWQGEEIIWAVTLNAEYQGEERGLSYTTDDGLTWNTTLGQERAYNVVAYENIILAATDNGLWKSIDGGSSWDLHYSIQKVFDVAMDSEGRFWIGTNYGLIVIDETLSKTVRLLPLTNTLTNPAYIVPALIYEDILLNNR